MANDDDNLHWTIRRDIMGGWAWECFNGVLQVAHCDYHFATRDACIQDAERHGYRNEEQTA